MYYFDRYETEKALAVIINAVLKKNPSLTPVKTISMAKADFQDQINSAFPNRTSIGRDNLVMQSGLRRPR